MSEFLKKHWFKIAVAVMLFGGSYAVGAISTIHPVTDRERFYDELPAIIGLLDSEFFMGFVFMATVTIVMVVLWLLWLLHEVPLHRVQREGMVHVDLVFGLSLCGLFINKAWWVVAIIVAFTPWRSLGRALSGVIREGVRRDEP